MLLALAGCGQDGPPPLPPLPDGALEAVVVEPGVPREPLARAVDALFTRDGIGETRAVVVMHGGKVVAERYADGYDANTRFVGWSMSKTVTAVLVGIMEGDGRLALDDPPPIDHWQRAGDPRGEITLRHLLQMRSGLRHAEMVEPRYESSEVRMMFLDGRDDMAAWAEAQPLDHEPGQHFQYSTASTVILGDVLARLLVPDGGPSDRVEAVSDFVAARLAGPVGMSSLVGEYDAAGTLVAGSSFWANARDWAKFGELLRTGGVVGGVQVVPRGWVDFMRSPSPRAPDYGAQMWLNHQSEVDDREVLFPDQGRETLFGAAGHMGQYLLVSPSQRLTVVRLGHTPNEEADALVDALAEIFALYPER
ncbi:serine hydrolase domain-containing protein [Alteraurantiacibacter aquimixticola]|uniref:serine hydrolase domain-containing protein n=1 Tax=Alteraurantiacibacter aquimixticola TaxID=2489173 RepID=UPI001FE9A268|nr:serine hydrolase [Alteraurantiacibacter aquimixticola]